MKTNNNIEQDITDTKETLVTIAIFIILPLVLLLTMYHFFKPYEQHPSTPFTTHNTTHNTTLKTCLKENPELIKLIVQCAENNPLHSCENIITSLTCNTYLPNNQLPLTQ